MGPIRLALMSDFHGHLPKVAACDGVVIAGDIVPPLRLKEQVDWFWTEFVPWTNELPTGWVVYTWGNHDWIGYHELVNPAMLPQHVTQLVDEGCVRSGIRIYGTPWQPTFYDWAYNLDESELAEKWELIPDNTDLLLLHGPPHRYGDRVGREHVGSPSLTKRISTIRPSLVVCGHIHCARGRYTIPHATGESTEVYNVALVDEAYRPTNEVVYYEWS